MAVINSVLTDFVYSEILNMILSLQIKPGERIREDLLAEKLGVSRTPVREAVNRLTQNGFITSVKRKGLYCVEVTQKDLYDLLDLRTVLESLSFHKCIDIATNKQLDHFQEIIQDFHSKFNAIIRHTDASTSTEIALLHNDYDVRFHVGIAAISTSTRLIKYISEVENLLLIARQRIYRSSESTNIVLLSWKQHELILEALRTRDKDAATSMLEEHLMLMKKTQVEVDAYENAAKEN